MLNTTLIYIPVQLLPNATAGSSSCVTVIIPDNENLNEESRTQITLALGNSNGVQIADGGGAATVIISDDDGMQRKQKSLNHNFSTVATLATSLALNLGKEPCPNHFF